MTDRNIEIINSIVKVGLANLSKSLEEYRPALKRGSCKPIDVSWISERNLTNYISASFITFNKAKFYVHVEAAFPDDVQNHLDCIAIEPHKKIVVLIEAKRFYAESAQATLISNDIARLERYTPTCTYKDLNNNDSNYPHYALFAILKLHNS